MSPIDWYAVIGWVAALALAVLYVAGSRDRLGSFGTGAYLGCAVLAFMMAALRFADAF